MNSSVASKGILLVLGTALISGFAIFINKFGVSGFDPYLFAFLKNIVVATFLLGLVIAIKEFKTLRNLKKKDWLILSIIGLVGGAIPFLLFFKGLSMTSAANGAFIHKTMFIYVALLATVFLKEKITKKLLIAGVFLLVGNFYFLKFLPYELQVGDLLILLATLFWAVENTISKYALRTISPRIVAFGRMGIGSFFILLFLLFTGGLSAVATLTPLHWQWVLISSVILFGFVTTWYTGLKYIKVSVATTVLLLGSPITLLLTFIFQSRPFTENQMFGTFLILLGIIIAVGLKNLLDSFRSLPKLLYGRA